MILMTTAMSLNFLLLVNLVEVGLIGHPLFRLEFRGLPERANNGVSSAVCRTMDCYQLFSDTKKRKV